ncbi:L,D-transpeptidase family protein [Roseivirga echinicomitans]
MKFKWLAIILFTMLIILALLFPSFIFPQPPLAELAEAREKLSEAEKSQASEYAPDLYKKATILYDSAMVAWAKENDRFFFMKDFSHTKTHASKASELAILAKSTAQSLSKKTWSNYAKRLDLIDEQFERFDLKYKNIPLSQSLVKLLAQTRLLYHEVSVAHENGNSALLKEKLATLEKNITQLIGFAETTMADFFKDYPLWKQWVAIGIENSRKTNETVFIIDKMERLCYVYSKGKLTHTFNMELGANWVGDKMLSGDKTTPEGVYKVVKKKGNGQTKYYKALLLNYPNADDQKRFKENKAKGIIPKNATIGNLIEIHGDGGKGLDWTDGCVALNNNDMDKLFGLASENTQVIIVGSLKPLPVK